MKTLNRKIQRIDKVDYWVRWAIWNALIAFVFVLITVESQNYSFRTVLSLYAAVLVVYFWYLFILTKKRCHDAGKSTGYCVVCFLLMPFIIGDFLLLSTCLKESDGDNEWGCNEEKQEYESNRAYYGR